MNDHDPKTCDLSLWVGPGCRYPTLEDMARDAMRWHDEAQAEKMACMKAEEDVRLLRDAIDNFRTAVQEALTRSTIQKPKTREQRLEEALREIAAVYPNHFSGQDCQCFSCVARRALEEK